MSSTKLVRTAFQPTADQRRVFWGLWSAMFRPITEHHDAEMRKKLARMVGAKPHRVVSFDVKEDRNPKFLAKFMVMVGVGYEAWEPDAERTKKIFAGVPIRKSFDYFRHDVTVLAGFYDVTYNVDGSISRQAKSLAFANMEEDEFDKVYSAVAQVLVDHVLRNYKREDLDRVVDELLGFTA